MYLVLPTKYNTMSELRFELFLNTLRAALNHVFIKKIVVVDSSNKKILNFMRKHIKDDKIIFLEQEDQSQKKGGSIREGIRYVIDNYGENVIIAFQEPEKDNMLYHYWDLIKNNEVRDRWICNPRRLTTTWNSYPKEQYHSENFMNMYLSKLTGLDIDWSFGPVVFTGNVCEYFLKDNGKLWDAQIKPIYEAYKDDIEISEFKVAFMYPEAQKKQEEDNMDFIRKRKYQLEFMIEEMEKIVK